jgi:hypothetical protein
MKFVEFLDKHFGAILSVLAFLMAVGLWLSA